MGLNRIKITLNPATDNYQYIIKNIDEVKDNLSQEATTFSVPGKTYTKNILLGINGQENSLEIFWKMHDDGGTDYSNGTYSSTVNTIPEQISYLKDTVHNPSFDSEWTIVDSCGIYGDYSAPENGLELYLQSINISTYQRDSPKWRNCSMKLTPGELIK